MKCIPSTRPGRLVAAASVVIEIDEVFDARMTSGLVIVASRANSSHLACGSSKIASTT